MEDANQLELPNSIEEFLAGDIGTVSETVEVARLRNGTTEESNIICI